MFDSLWKNLTLATMSPDAEGFGIINKAVVGIKDRKIAYVGTLEGLGRPPEKLSDYVYDAEGRSATPGLIDCHTHLIYAGNRAAEFEQRLQGASYADIAKAGGGIMSTVSATRAATEEQLFRLGVDRLRALFFEGATAIEIKSGYGLDFDTERKILRVATRLRDDTDFRIQRTFLGAHALPPEYKNDADGYITLVCDMMRKLHAETLIDAVDAFCENIAFNTAQVRRVFETAKSLGLPVKLHAEQLSNMGGATLAAEFGALSADHLEHIDEAGVDAMAKANMAAVLLPGAFYYLREKQLPPIELLRKHKVPMALATDHNPGTSPTLSPLLMLNMACTLFRLTPEEALAGLTRHSAKALGWNDCGSIEVGKNADIVLWDCAHPRDLCYYFGHNPCYGTIMGGDWHPTDHE